MLASFVADLVGASVADVPAGTGAFAPALSRSPASPSDAAAVVVSSVASFEDGVEIVALQNLSALTESARERIFSHTLPYTARAFAAAHLQNGDLSTMSPEDRQDHLDHTFGGSGVTFLLGSPAGVADSNSAASSATSTRAAMRLHAHLNASFISPNAAMEGLGVIVYVHAVCCDPNFQGRGFAKKILTHAVRVLRPKARYLTLRTMNVAVVKLMASACNASVFPVDPFDAQKRSDLPRVAEALRTALWGQHCRAKRCSSLAGTLLF